MAAAGRETGEGAMRLKEGTRIKGQEETQGWGPTLLGRIQEVPGVRDAGVDGFQQPHKVLLVPGGIHE